MNKFHTTALVCFFIDFNIFLLAKSQTVVLNQTIIEECYTATATADITPVAFDYYFQWILLDEGTQHDLGFIFVNGSGNIEETRPSSQYESFYRVINSREQLDSPNQLFTSHLIFDLKNTSVSQYQFRIAADSTFYSTQEKNRSECKSANCFGDPCFCGLQTQENCTNIYVNETISGTCSVDNINDIAKCKHEPSNVNLEILSVDVDGTNLEVRCNFTDGFPEAHAYIQITDSDRKSIENGVNTDVGIVLDESYRGKTIYCEVENNLTLQYNESIQSEFYNFIIFVLPSVAENSGEMKFNTDNNNPLSLEISCYPNATDLQLIYENGTSSTNIKINQTDYVEDLSLLNVLISPVDKLWSDTDEGTYTILVTHNSSQTDYKLSFKLSPEKNSNGGLSGGEIAGIVCGCVAGSLLIGFLVYYFFIR